MSRLKSLFLISEMIAKLERTLSTAWQNKHQTHKNTNNWWRSQNAEKTTHIKRRQLDQAVILFNRLPFQNRNFKELAPRESEFLPLRKVPYDMENHFYYIKWPPLSVTIFITQVRNCVMGTTLMQIDNESTTADQSKWVMSRNTTITLQTNPGHREHWLHKTSGRQLK